MNAKDLADLTKRLHVLVDKHGPKSPETFAAREELALALSEAGANDFAIEELKVLEFLRRENHGQTDHATLATKLQLAREFVKVGRPEAAIYHFDALLPLQVEALGPDHPETCATRNELTDLLAEVAGSKGVPVINRLNKLLAAQEDALGKDDSRVQEIRGQLAPLVERLLEKREIYRSEHEGENLIGHALEEFDNNIAALYRKLIDLLSHLKGRDDPKTLEVRAAYNGFLHYSDTDDREDTASRMNALLEDQTRVLGSAHPETIETRELLENITSNWFRFDGSMQALFSEEELLRLRRRLTKLEAERKRLN